MMPPSTIEPANPDGLGIRHEEDPSFHQFDHRKHPDPHRPLVAQIKRAQTWITTEGRQEIPVLIAIVVAILGIWLFAEIADGVIEGDRQQLDEQVLLALRQPGNPAVPIGPHWLLLAALDLTALGGVTVILLVNVISLGYLALLRKWNSLWIMTAAVIGGGLGTTLLKEFFGRARPSIVPHLAEVDSSSFPSGHSMLAAVTYFTIGAILARAAHGRRRKVYILLVATFVTFLVGVTRIYLGVHYPSDVLAGWSAGAVWALTCLLVAKRLENAGLLNRKRRA